MLAKEEPRCYGLTSVTQIYGIQLYTHVTIKET